MGESLAQKTAAHLHRLAADCDTVQAAIGDLLRSGAFDQSDGQRAGLAPQTMRELQGLDRIAQLLRDLAAVQRALSVSGDAPDEAAVAHALGAALLEDTRKALAFDPPDATTSELGVENRARNDGGCQFL